MGVLRLEVPGAPRPQGSHRVLVGPDGRTRVLESAGRALAEWRSAVAWEARRASRGRPLEGPVAVDVTFFVPRPRRPAGPLPARRPDLDKLLRALLDGLVTGRAVVDDSQVTDVCCRKRYADRRPRTVVELWELEGDVG
ncbi:MAG TPA: RusA family crossover junction endodeoxyribonuclease [Actinomycetota bacterium]|nr:RusA family crossover junction endodeoxyribonuclease [Actinomycetota bacterium]